MRSNTIDQPQHQTWDVTCQVMNLLQHYTNQQCGVNNSKLINIYTKRWSACTHSGPKKVCDVDLVEWSTGNGMHAS